jgi:hypothetical protein
LFGRSPSVTIARTGPFIVQMTSGTVRLAVGFGIQPAGNNARRSIAASAQCRPMILSAPTMFLSASQADGQA